jgi:hypothetical protein
LAVPQSPCLELYLIRQPGVCGCVGSLFFPPKGSVIVCLPVPPGRCAWHKAWWCVAMASDHRDVSEMARRGEWCTRQVQGECVGEKGRGKEGAEEKATTTGDG